MRDEKGSVYGTSTHNGQYLELLLPTSTAGFKTVKNISSFTQRFASSEPRTVLKIHLRKLGVHEGVHIEGKHIVRPHARRG